ncbi:biotin--[acetyl-CoA-carboxylase] ligase [Campylobacter gracilis]|uniref:Biotin--[acetyl-CoA-carboxylase] ligase n=1 Tax=Campylobacter gracilis RM3268 TaxID=553220 RepID=C8PEW9_9BACT|nr:biotin--[acetyl-CoA-carboxylase] ligase [Campylobacter gracilis]AKT91841.1 biotin-[acetyl-CoA-carboxylase] ligase [Campylobacter gracilis]EEV18597.1 biotin--[acetyl-CoA-carboxylase] ligase [Campylobacter gracilis RM3268]UEB45955.1 biotin--[acetyl-CoA-carboxylase] ligase [Campylobacter gracilis]SUW77708.1 biotin--protein ligase [Campylobacter gracilis]
MKIKFVEQIASTQEFLVGAVREGRITPPFAIAANRQSAGIGSRGNDWEGVSGNLAFSFCVAQTDLPADVPPQSASIYFAMIMQELLASLGSQLWLKWPNDFYLGERKIGGAMTNKIKNTLVCGIGMNLLGAPEYAGILDIKISAKDAIDGFFALYENKIPWKQIFRNFSLQFQKSQNFSVHLGGEKISLAQAKLCEDGSIIINEERVYALR